MVQEGNDLAVDVRARGIGTPVTSPDDLTLIDFGTQYTTRTITKKYEVQNRGRKTRKLVWQVVKDAKNKKEGSSIPGLGPEVRVFRRIPSVFVSL